MSESNDVVKPLPASSQPAGPDAPRGMFDGFESYRSPSQEDYRGVMASGIVVPDANVLLDLYRYTEQARLDLLAVLRGLGGQLWVPHQVLQEFWQHRSRTLTAPATSAEVTTRELASHRDKALATLRTWANRFALPEEDFNQLHSLLTAGFRDLSDAVDGLVEKHAGLSEPHTGADPVVCELERVLSGRVGRGFEGDVLRAAVAEGVRRVEAKIPPGFKDSGKQGDDRAGDYLVWEQVLQEAERRQCDVLLVTGDTKEDWWRKENGMPRGPHQALIDELASRAGTRLFMLTPKLFTRLGSEILDVDVHEESLEDIDRVNRLRVEEDDEAITTEATEKADWDEESLQALFDALMSAGYADRVAVIRWAADNQGFVHHEAVRELCSYTQDSRLNGLTRPVSRITDALQAQGRVVPDVAPLLAAEYDPSYSYVKASGFRLHSSASPLVLAMAEEQEAESDD